MGSRTARRKIASLDILERAGYALVLACGLGISHRVSNIPWDLVLLYFVVRPIPDSLPRFSPWAGIPAALLAVALTWLAVRNPKQIPSKIFLIPLATFGMGLVMMVDPRRKLIEPFEAGLQAAKSKLPSWACESVQWSITTAAPPSKNDRHE